MGSRTLMPVAFSYTIPSGSRQRTTSLSRAGDIDWNRSIGPEKNARILLSKNQFSFPKIFGRKTDRSTPNFFQKFFQKIRTGKSNGKAKSPNHEDRSSTPTNNLLSSEHYLFISN